MSSLIQQPMCKIQVFFLVCNIVQFDKRQFGFFVTVQPMTWFECIEPIVGQLYCYVEKFSFSRCLVVSYGSFDEMATIVHFMSSCIRPWTQVFSKTITFF